MCTKCKGLIKAQKNIVVSYAMSWPQAVRILAD